jgi:hypothetical protein
MDFLQKYFNGVFELPLPRNAQKRTKKKVKKKSSDGGWVGLRFSKCAGGVRRFVFWRPLAPPPPSERGGDLSLLSASEWMLAVYIIAGGYYRRCRLLPLLPLLSLLSPMPMRLVRCLLGELDTAGHTDALEFPLVFTSDDIAADVELDQRPIAG